MNNRKKLVICLCSVLLSIGVAPLSAQTEEEGKGQPRPEGRPQRGPGGAGGGPARGERGPRSIPPILKALDANGDREISAEEIANATAALKTLDKNGDGKLTAEELRPEGSSPRGQRPPGGRPEGGQRGKGRPSGKGAGKGKGGTESGGGETKPKRPPLEEEDSGTSA